MMKRWLVAVASTGVLIVVGTAQAQVVSSYANPITSASLQDKPLAGYDGGFILRSADDDFRLQIVSRLQFQYFYQDIRKAGSVDTA